MPGEHPFRLYRKAGVPMVLNTDDEGVLRSNLTVEYLKAARWFGLGYADLKELAYNSLEYSVLPGESLYEGRDYRRPKEKAPEGSRKAEMQRRLADEFTAFEGTMKANAAMFR
jgi:adenosine deaminase